MIQEKRNIFKVIHKEKEGGMIERRNQSQFPEMEKGYLEKMAQIRGCLSEEEGIA